MRVSQVTNFGPSFEAGQILVGANVSILHHVLGLGIIAQDGTGYTIESLVVSAHQEFVKGSFTVQDPPYDLFVAPIFLPCLLQERCSCHTVLLTRLSVQGGLGYRAKWRASHEAT